MWEKQSFPWFSNFELYEMLLLWFDAAHFMRPGVNVAQPGLHTDITVSFKHKKAAVKCFTKSFLS